MKELLSGVITDPDTLPLSRRSFSSPFGTFMAPWWLEREYLRMENEVYPLGTSVLDTLNNAMPQYAVHVSKEDMTMIAYTPSANEGTRDKQIRSTLARFLTKFYGHLDDVSIADLQAKHKAELDPTVEVLYGQDIVTVYKQGGNKSCMSGSDKHFIYGHPAQVYDMPNISMAVLRDGHGKVNARCMLYTPSETDKRYIRVYGDDLLRRKLERLGYRKGSWHGVEFKKILAKEGYYLMPYLDSNNTVCNGYRTGAVALIDGKLRSIEEGPALSIKSGYGDCHVACASSTTGIVRLEPVVDEQFVCPLTGISYSKLSSDFELVDYWDGKTVRKVAADGVNNMLSVQLYDGARRRYVYVSASSTGWGKAPGLPVYSYNGDTYLDVPYSRECHGYVKLSKRFYRDDAYYKSSILVFIGGDEYIKPEDVAYIARGDRFDGFASRHKSELTSEHVKVHSITKERSYYGLASMIVKTRSGRKVVPKAHDVVQLVDGTWDFTRNTKSTKVIFDTVHVGKKDDFPQIGDAIYHDKVRALFTTDYMHLDQVLSRLMQEKVSRYITVDGDYNYVSGYHPKPWPKIWPKLMEYPLAQVVNYEYEVFFAEANAHDYNGQHTAAVAAEPVPEEAPSLKLSTLLGVATTELSDSFSDRAYSQAVSDLAALAA